MNADKKRVRIAELLRKLKDGQEITLRDFKSVLGKDEYAEYEAMWANEKDKREAVKPKEILLYEKKLREVKLADSRYEKRRQNYGSCHISLKLEQHTEHLMERLIEYWNDLVTSNSSLMIWFDRSQVEGLSMEDLPHVVYSKSLNKKSDGFFTKRTKKDIKIEILEKALNPIQEIETEKVEIKIGRRKLTKSDFKDLKVK